MANQLDLALSTPVSESSDGWISGHSRPRGAMAYTHLIRSPSDPLRSPRHFTKATRLRWKDPISRWSDAILGLLANQEPRTFNAIVVELADVTADMAFLEAPDHALWGLVSTGKVEHTPQAPVLFRLATPTNPTSSRPAEKGGTRVEDGLCAAASLGFLGLFVQSKRFLTP